MSATTYSAKARRHWTKWLPQKVASLKASGELEASIQAAGRLAQQRVMGLMQQGFQQHEAEEVAMAEFVLLAPEPGAGLEKWEQDELATLEREYRKMMRG